MFDPAFRMGNHHARRPVDSSVVDNKASLARLKGALDRHDYEPAREQAEEALESTFGDPWREPEARTAKRSPPSKS